MKQKRLPILVIAIIATCTLVAGLLIVICVVPLRQHVRSNLESTIAHSQSTPAKEFPDIDTTNLNDTQQKIVAITKQEYNKKPVSYDAAVQVYTQGNKEAWCADFASWVMKEAGTPFSNPYSGSWRIPGVYTLQEYFQSKHAYKEAGSYIPKTGDMVIFLTNRSHTNIVLAVNGDTMTTVGGNEDGHIRINTQKYTPGTEGLSGFGVLPTE